MSPPAEKGKEKEAEPDPPVFRPFSRRRVNPRAASGGGTWEDAPPVFMLFQKGFPALLWTFEGLFCNF